MNHVQSVYDTLKDSQMITLRQKEAHGRLSGSGIEQTSILSLQRSHRRTFNNQMPPITQGTSTAKCAVLASPDSPNTATSSSRQLSNTTCTLRCNNVLFEINSAVSNGLQDA